MRVTHYKYIIMRWRLSGLAPRMSIWFRQQNAVTAGVFQRGRGVQSRSLRTIETDSTLSINFELVNTYQGLGVRVSRNSIGFPAAKTLLTILFFNGRLS